MYLKHTLVLQCVGYDVHFQSAYDRFKTTIIQLHSFMSVGYDTNCCFVCVCVGDYYPSLRSLLLSETNAIELKL